MTPQHPSPRHGAVVTGAAGGIGGAIARLLAASGTAVVITDRDGDALGRAHDRLRRQGARVTALPIDLTRPPAIDALLRHATAHLPRLDTIVNAAGLCRGVPFRRLTTALWQQTLAIDLEIPLRLCGAAAPHLRSAGGGTILNIASIAGLRPFPFAPHYAAAKAELISLTKVMAVTWAAAGIRVNALCPGWTRTAMTEVFWKDPHPSQVPLHQVPLGRWATVDEIAAAAVFLTSTPHITGAVLVADGGLLAHHPPPHPGR
ncbi:SDR family NAD(P)-dependent oxidoreductase [Actinomadura rubrisoli]|uniref:SDR family oxidoreductase n=1 Tax=Actinomadura rubrisoli TaxID=2530368 RepID=A0A4R5BFT7_9ACTN|nr:SDR family oxidoreductase [Actinomadura rubrisoli]TDD82684.1 SDR family oxidoreductase [Actinomadura rubrisoli]